MESLKDQTRQTQLQAGVDHCEKTFDAPGEKLVNIYKCNQSKFANSDLWAINRNKKQVSIRTSMF